MLSVDGAAESVKLGAGVTVRATVVLPVAVPEAPVIVTVALDCGAVAAAFSVSTLLALVVVAGLKEAVTPVGRPLAENPMDPVKPPRRDTAIVVVPLEPAAMLIAVGAAESVNPRTVRATTACAMLAPALPVMVTFETPAVAAFEAVKVTVVLRDEAAGLKLAVTPDGRPLAANATDPLKPLFGATAITLVPVPP
jgi:hypothetical protein